MKSKILLVVSILFSALFIFSGANKLFNFVPPPTDENTLKLFGAFMQIKWLMPLVAVAEIIGGILFAIPKTRALGAIIILPVMVGIILTHIVDAPATLPMAIVLFAINVWVIYENREKYMPMIK
jgi:putative oxidoreductase